MEEKRGRRGRHRSRSEARRLLRSFRESGLTQRRWCSERGIGLSTLRYWLKRDREESGMHTLVPVEIEGRGAWGSELELQVKGIELRIGAGSDLGMLAQLVKELQ